MMRVCLALGLTTWWPPLPAQADPSVVGQRIVAAYPDHLSRLDNGNLVWRDGTLMPLYDGRTDKSFEEWLDRPSIADMLAQPYPRGPAGPVARNQDPGRARNTAFFDKMYGDCAKGEVSANLVDVVWMAGSAPQKLKVTRVNGVAERLAAVSRELEALPAQLRKYLSPSAGTYVCRPIAGTDRRSAHGYGIAIDISVKQADYWRWAKPGKDGSRAWRNRVPIEIVEVFERHGFIWGGRWYHYDTMHFEYRPELLAGK